ncbi:hypothetical protein GCM10011583_74350 [Streptomyces camponoticapitis]|uniref:Uncharacterized protein n=1 Tax=Streptomyces camponoticapitis TaxID=1616125 RepID=A0ABQ2F1L2_9ACTN|nr:hypothetical protein GCM10011583_74350 [Streptomyces camponoticapitis]
MTTDHWVDSVRAGSADGLFENGTGEPQVKMRAQSVRGGTNERPGGGSRIGSPTTESDPVAAPQGRRRRPPCGEFPYGSHHPEVFAMIRTREPGKIQTTDPRACPQSLLVVGKSW